MGIGRVDGLPGVTSGGVFSYVIGIITTGFCSEITNSNKRQILVAQKRRIPKSHKFLWLQNLPNKIGIQYNRSRQSHQFLLCKNVRICHCHKNGSTTKLNLPIFNFVFFLYYDPFRSVLAANVRWFLGMTSEAHGSGCVYECVSAIWRFGGLEAIFSFNANHLGWHAFTWISTKWTIFIIGRQFHR